ncbi:hypothetical protein VNO77_21552 [Canavalia gladiata]|uniref:DUF4378 domain-containing protein n=1 Tax=Canavalia gladiata TaxID=3824 RepID=A0AAN9LWD4_CANGL
MESEHQTSSVILQLMGLVKVPTQHPVRDKQKVLSENYLQKVASVGVRKKRSSPHRHSCGMNTHEKEEPEDVIKVVKVIRRDQHHNPSRGNGKENPFLSGTKVKDVPQHLDASVNWKPETLIDTISSFNVETSVNSGRIWEQGNLLLQQKMNDALQKDVHGEAGLYETFGLSKSHLDPKDETLNLKSFPFPSSCQNSHLADELLKEIFYPKSMRVYPEMRDRKKIFYHKNFGKLSSRSFSKISEDVSMQTGNVANRVLHTASSSFFKGNVGFANDTPKPSSNISVNEIQCNSPFFCSDGSYVGLEARNTTLEHRDETEKLQELGQHGQDSTHNQLVMISEHGNGARNLTHQSGFGNDKIERNIKCKIGVNYRFARKVPRPLCAASVDSCGTINQDNLFQRYWGLRKNPSVNWSTWKSMNRPEKFPSFSSHFNSNHTEENFIGHKSEKKCYLNEFSGKKTMLPQLSSSSPSPTLIDNQILHEICLVKDEVKNKKHEDCNMSKQNIVSPDSSVDCLVSDAMTEDVGWSHNNPTKQQSKSTVFILSQGDTESLNHTSYASKQQDTSDFQEDSVHSLFSETDPDSLGSFEEAYGPSPISVLDPSFIEDIPFSSKCDDSVYDSSEVDDEEFALNVSSDEDCGKETEGDFEEKKDIEGLFRAEESRDFSYVVEVLTEAGIFNRSLFSDFSTWHSADCPISPSVFEILEKKFGEQQLWKRSERRLLFDRVNTGLLEILQPYLYIPMWEKPVSRRLNAEPSQDMIEEVMWGFLVAQEKKASKDSADNMLGGEVRWTELGEDIEDIVREIVKLLIEELANEIVSLENF